MGDMTDYQLSSDDRVEASYQPRADAIPPQPYCAHPRQRETRHVECPDCGLDFLLALADQPRADAIACTCKNGDGTTPAKYHAASCPVRSADKPRDAAIAEVLTDAEKRRIAEWLAGDDVVSLASLFSDAAAYPWVSKAVRAALSTATPARAPEGVHCASCDGHSCPDV